jgi:hemerythrin-like domain-containing protein
LLKIGGQADHGFDEPLGLLSDCHRRIEFFLHALLRVSRDERGRELSDGGRRALERALAYFATAAPRHTADEEESLFPVLRASDRLEAADVTSVVERLEGDHRRADEAHATVHRLASRWIEAGRLADEEGRELTDTLESLRGIYEGHIAVEEREVFPAAARLLSPAQLEGVGRQMAERRGVKYPAKG